MFAVTEKPLNGGRGMKYHLLAHQQPLPAGELLSLWQSDEDFREFFTELLVASPFSAFRWETPCWTRNRLDRPAEFVLLDYPPLQRHPEFEAFAEHFEESSTDELAGAFTNLGKDALLIVPNQLTNPTNYSHLAAFLRTAPAEQIHAIWQLVGKSMADQIDDTPRWLSTAGMGVAWLHVRIDTKPKYYGHVPYKDASYGG